MTIKEKKIVFIIIFNFIHKFIKLSNFWQRIHLSNKDGNKIFLAKVTYNSAVDNK